MKTKTVSTDMLPPRKLRWSLEKVYLSEKTWLPGRNQRNEIAINLGAKGHTLKFGPSNFGNSCVHWRGQTIPIKKLVAALDSAFSKQ